MINPYKAMGKRPLNQRETDCLACGEQVIVHWASGTGPFLYNVRRHRGEPWVVIEGDAHTLVGKIGLVGEQRWETRVWAVR